MKTIKWIFQLATLSVIVAFTACNSGEQKKAADHNSSTNIVSEQMANEHSEKAETVMHVGHKGLAENFAHTNIAILETKANINEASTNEFEEVINAYLQIKDALVNDNETKTDEAITIMAGKLKEVSEEKLLGEGLATWQNHQILYEAKLKEMKHIKGIENKRSYFSHISEIMYCTIKSFGLKEGDLYAVYCPMAFNNKGAYWISDSKMIQNPYMGSKMPACGTIEEAL